MATLAEQLDSVQTAIAAIEQHGQSYTIDDVTYNRGNLKVLYDREERLHRKIANETMHGRTRVEF